MAICPDCKEDSIDLQFGYETAQYYCKKCGYVGKIFLEKQDKVTEKDKAILKDMKESEKNAK